MTAAPSYTILISSTFIPIILVTLFRMAGLNSPILEKLEGTRAAEARKEKRVDC